jgi:ribose-phosphate pyrophosphokinase
VVVVLTTKSPLAKQIAQMLDLDLIQAEVGDFADTETFLKIDGVQEKEILLVHQFSFDTPINDQLMKLLLLVHQVKACGAKRIKLVVPYLPYARQCKDFLGKTVGPFEAVGKMCKSVGVDEVIACDLHEENCEDIFSVPLQNVSLAGLWRGVLQEDVNLVDVCFVSPDRGGIDRVKNVAGERATAFIEKERIGKDQSESLRLVGDVTGKNVVLIDDIIDTGTTVLHAIEMLEQNGAKKIFGCFSHAVLSGTAATQLGQSALEKIWVTDSILDKSKLGSKFSVVSIAEHLAEVL